MGRKKKYVLSNPFDGTRHSPGEIDQAILALYQLTDDIRISWPAALFCCCDRCISPDAIKYFTRHELRYSCPSWLAGHLMGGCRSFEISPEPISPNHEGSKATDHVEEALWLMPIVLEEWLRHKLNPEAQNYQFGFDSPLEGMIVPPRPSEAIAPKLKAAVAHFFELVTPKLKGNLGGSWDCLDLEVLFCGDPVAVIKRRLGLDPACLPFILDWLSDDFSEDAWLNNIERKQVKDYWMNELGGRVNPED